MLQIINLIVHTKTLQTVNDIASTSCYDDIFIIVFVV